MEPADLVPASTFERFFTSGKLREHERDYLLAHYAAPNRTATTPQIGTVLESSMGRVNITCGQLGRRIADGLGMELGRRIPSSVLVEFDKLGGPHWYAIQRDTVATAIERLGWAAEAVACFADRYPAMVFSSLPDSSLLEALAREANTIARASNADVREACIAHHGPVCVVCGFDFEAAYGELGRGAIEVHHDNSPVARAGAYAIDPVSDLKPVCANCHRMLHRGSAPGMTIDALRSHLAAHRPRPRRRTPGR
jgi:hypothetical protein